MDESFPTNQFLLEGYSSPYRLDINGRSGGLLVYVNENIPSRILTSYQFETNIQIIPIEINLKKERWVIFSIYRPPKQCFKSFLQVLSSTIDFYTRIYKNILVMGDFNSEPQDPVLKSFCVKHDFYNHIKSPTCWKSNSGKCSDLILSNQKSSLMNTGTVETGISDHHSLIYTMLKSTFEKLEPRKYYYRNLNGLENCKFQDYLSSNLSDCEPSYEIFHQNLVSALNKFAPIKTRFLRANDKPHMTKILRKAIMTRSRLKNIANSSKLPEDISRYKAQRNLVVHLNRKTKKSFYKSSTARGSKSFWDTCKPFFSEKSAGHHSRIILVDDDEIISNDQEIATTFSNFFGNIISSLPISRWNLNFIPCSDDAVINTLNKFKDHPSVINIRNRMPCQGFFNFQLFSETEVYHEILHLDSTKKVSGDIPIRVLKESVKEITPILTRCFNTSLEEGVFPNELKLADVIPSHKKGSKTDKANFRPISLLPALSKVFEKLISKQLQQFMQNKLSKYLCGFRKGFSTQYALLQLLQVWQKTLSNSGRVGTILMDLSKAFDCLAHDLLVAKLGAYGLGYYALKLLLNYLSDRKMRVRIGANFSEWVNVLFGVPQGSILGPLLFNIFINGLFFLSLESKICNFADDNTLYVCDTSFEAVLQKLLEDVPVVIHWFRKNEMAVNPKKFQVMFLGCDKQGLQIPIDNTTIISSNSVRLLGIIIDHRLTFNDHIFEICNKANRKISALLRIRNFLNKKQAEILSNSYILSAFNYCPLIWMFCTKTAGQKIDSTHKRAIRAINLDFSTHSPDLFETYNVIPIHRRNLELLLIEVFKTLHHLNPELMWNLFSVKHIKYQLRRGVTLELPALPARNGQNTFLFRAIMAWNHLPAKTKATDSLSEFISQLKSLVIYCHCTYCR